MPQDLLDLGQEAHVEHAVGLVQHQDFESAEPRIWVTEMVEKAARCGDEHVSAAAEGMLLRTHAHAAEDGGSGDGRVHGEGIQVLKDLGRELARGRDDQGAGGTPRLPQQALQDRQKKGCRLPAASHGAGEHVAPGQRRRNRVDLDRGGSYESEFPDALEQVGMQAQRRERHGVFPGGRETISKGEA